MLGEFSVRPKVVVPCPVVIGVLIWSPRMSRLGSNSPGDGLELTAVLLLEASSCG